MSLTDDQIVARAVALDGVVDLDEIPERLWDRVCSERWERTHAWWRERGWTVTQSTCDKGCCPRVTYTPPGCEPTTGDHPCPRDRPRKVLSRWSAQQAP